jgi:hypothetical protein
MHPLHGAMACAFSVVWQFSSPENTLFCNRSNSTPRNKTVMKRVLARVARWYFFKQKIPIWVNFGGSCNGIWRYILMPFA